MIEKNEFEDLVAEQTEEDLVTESNTPVTPGMVYDYTTAPTFVQAPPRKNLDGKIVIINKAEIFLPEEDKPWQKSMNGIHRYKACTFVLHYNGNEEANGQQEFLSGVRVFPSIDIKTGKEKYSHPCIMRNGRNQASKLLVKYAEHISEDPKNVDLFNFLDFLNKKPKAQIEVEEFKNPETGDIVKKNMVGKFICQN